MSQHDTGPMFLTSSQIDMVLAIRHARRHSCAYGPEAERCDCRFGATFIGEKTGCPELATAAHLIQAMTLEEISLLKERVERKWRSEQIKHDQRAEQDANIAQLRKPWL